MPLALLALAVAAFGIGTTEFVIMGLLPDVARDLGGPISCRVAGPLSLAVTIPAHDAQGKVAARHLSSPL